MAASFRDPSASAVWCSRNKHRTVSIAHYHPGVGNIVRPEELVQASDERERGEDVSLEHSDITFTQLGSLTHTIPVAAVNTTWMMLNSHLRANA